MKTYQMIKIQEEKEEENKTTTSSRDNIGNYIFTVSWISHGFPLKQYGWTELS